MDHINWIIIKRALKISWLTFVAIASVLFAGALTLQLPQVQTAIADEVMTSLSERLDGNISIEKIHLKPFTTLVLKNAVITDKHPAKDPYDSTLAQVDTFFTAEYIIAKFTLDGLLNKESIRIRSAYVGNAQMNLVLEDRYDENGVRDPHDNLSRIFRIEKPQKHKDPSPKEIFRINNVEISDMGFSMLNRSTNKTAYYGGINWNDLDIRHIDLDARGLRFKDGIMYGKAENLSFEEKSGFVCTNMAGEARVGRGKTIVENLHMTDEWSDIDIPLFMMSYSGIKDFSDFIRKVRLDAELNPSRLDFRTITYFAPQLENNRLQATVSGSMSGYVDDFSVNGLKIRSHAGGFSGTVNGKMTGIPEVYEMRIDAELTDLKLTIDGLGRFVSEWMPDGELDLERFGNGSVFTGRASAKGLLNHLDTKAYLSSDLGKVQAAVKLDELIRPSRPITITGTVSTTDLNIGEIIESKTIGPVTAGTDVSLKIDENLSVDINHLNIERLNLLGYDYNDIQARGRYDKNSLNGTVISKDPNLNFIFQGGYAKSDKSRNTVYKFDASVGHADLNAINLDKRGKSVVQFRTNANFTETGRGKILGRIDIGEIMLENRTGRYEVGDVVITSHSTDNHYTTRLKSRFADAVYNGSSSFVDFLKDLQKITIGNEIPALYKDSSHTWKGNQYDIEFTCHDVQNVLAFAAPGLYIENGTSLKADIDRDGNMKAAMTSGRIAYKRNYMKGVNMVFDNSDNALNGKLTCEEISASRIGMKENILSIHINDNHIGAGFSFDNHSDPETKGELIINGNVSSEEDTPVFDIAIRPSSLHYNSHEWNIQPSSIRINGSDIEVDTFGVVSGEQSVGIFGRASAETEEVLTLNLERFDLSMINAMLPSDFGVRGAVTGVAQLTSPFGDPELMVDMVSDSTHIANVPLGVLKVGMIWDESFERFNFFADNSLQDVCNIDMKGHYTPKNKWIHADADLNHLNIGYAQPFLKDIFSSMSGSINGKLAIDGPVDRLSLTSSNASLENAGLTITYTGVPYTADGPFHADDTGVYFDGITIRDRYNGSGTVTGSINYDHFKNIMFDTRIAVDRIEAVNLKESAGEPFYGRIFGSGNVTITGPVNSLVMDIDAATSKTGELHIPISASLSSSKGTNLLKFKEIDTGEEIDPYEIFVQRTDKEEVSDSDFLVRLNVAAGPEVEAFVEIDKASGNVLSGRGSGNISLDVSDDMFNINGDYTINSGIYKFVAMGLVGRDFTIQDGSSIRFNGDIMESTLDIDATYRTKASISTLISDTTSIANRRTVDCGISIKDKLSNPELSFSIEIPDLDPTIKSRVESALSTEDKVQKQFLSLIISNNFLPDEQSGIVNNTSVLYSNVTEMMANQINNILQKLNIPLDLGLNYQPNERGNDIFDVAVSTQLFNNRVIVNGNIGNRQYSGSSTQNDVVGDIDIEIKLDRSGSFRLNLFSHSADQYTNYLDNSQRNGVGITYQTEFNSFGQFIKNIFSSRQKRIENRRNEEQAVLNEKRVKLEIQPSNR